jgi:hypothetical protein
MIIDKQKIIKDIQGDYYHHYLVNFSNIKEDIKYIKNNPNYETASSRYIKIKNYPNAKKNIKKIYGNDVDVILEVSKSKINRVVDVLYINEDEYDLWFKNLMNDKQKSINFYNTCYNIDKKQIVVSIVYMERN